MTLASVNTESPGSNDRLAAKDSAMSQHIKETLATQGVIRLSKDGIPASSGNYERDLDNHEHLGLKDGGITKHWPTTPQKVVSVSHIHIPREHLPLTPAHTPTRGSKRAYPSENKRSPETPCNKRRSSQALQSPSKSPFRTELIPKHSILYDRRAARANTISALELKRASESILSQVDWDEVEEQVASNRRGSTFRKAIKDILQDRVDELFESGC